MGDEKVNVSLFVVPSLYQRSATLSIFSILPLTQSKSIFWCTPAPIFTFSSSYYVHNTQTRHDKILYRITSICCRIVYVEERLTATCGVSRPRTRSFLGSHPVVSCGPRKVVFAHYGTAARDRRGNTPEQSQSSAIDTCYRC